MDSSNSLQQEKKNKKSTAADYVADIDRDRKEILAFTPTTPQSSGGTVSRTEREVCWLA